VSRAGSLTGTRGYSVASALVAALLWSAPTFAQSAAAAPGTEDEAPHSASPPTQPVAAPPSTQPAAPPPGWSAPPPGWSPPPGYYYVAPQAPPPEYPIKSNQPLIAGYHVEERPRQAPITVGLIIGGAAYAIGLFAASSDGFANGKGWLVVPVLGPWLAMGARKNRCAPLSSSTSVSYVSDCLDDDSARALLILDGIHQAAGALLVVMGLTIKRSWAVRDGVQVQVLPQFQADRVGLSLVGNM